MRRRAGLPRDPWLGLRRGRFGPLSGKRNAARGIRRSAALEWPSAVGRPNAGPVSLHDIERLGLQPVAERAVPRVASRAARVVAGFVSVEAAVDFVAAGDQCGEPGRIGSHTGGGQAEAIRVHLVIADRIDGRLAEDELPGSRSTKPEEPRVFARAGRYPSPDVRSRAAEFGTDWPLRFSGHQQEDRVATAVGVELAGFNQPFQHGVGETATLCEIPADADQLSLVGHGQPQWAAALGNRTWPARIGRGGVNDGVTVSFMVERGDRGNRFGVRDRGGMIGRLQTGYQDSRVF